MATALEQEIGHGNAGLTPWSAFVDVTETVPELAWPNSLNTYSAMRTDALHSPHPPVPLVHRPERCPG
jgi:hypothetical protein